MMSLIRSISAMIAALALFTAVPAADAAESYDNCTGFITSLPATISTQGTWCMSSDLATGITSGAAITINTNNVTIDCNNFKLGGLSAGLGTTTRGVYALDKLNATVRNCSIRGFYYGVLFLGNTAAASGGHLITDNRFDGNTYVSVFVVGDGSVIQRNRIIDTGLSTVSASAFGVNTTYSVDVLDNLVSGVTARAGGNGGAEGIRTDSNADGSISENRIRGLAKDGSGVANGIFNAVSDRITLRGNHVVGSGATAITCTSNHGRAVGNTIGGYTNSIIGCGDIGNDITP